MQGYSALCQQLAQDYNVHSAVVVGQAPPQAGTAVGVFSSNARGSAGASTAAAVAQAAGPSGGSKGGVEVSNELSEEEHQRYREQTGVVLEDLQAPPQHQFEELRVTDPRLYFRTMQNQQQQGQQQQGQQQQGQQPGQPPGAKKQQQQTVLELLRSIDPYNLLDPPIKPSAAKQVLHKMSGGDSSSAAAARTGPSSLPQEKLDFVQQQAMLIDELLRHFWGMVPINTEEKRAKFVRLQRSMDTVYEGLNKFVQQCEPLHKAALNRLVKPLWEQLDHNIHAMKSAERALQEQLGKAAALKQQRQRQGQARQRVS
eukprot:GHRR01023582.1.p1 GENE.GHRR01023582.1~~GHRR01023582.1.p1  ORF type:complete len:313 (+),score=147.44 GHRR01023582.1:359-1297(+)